MATIQSIDIKTAAEWLQKKEAVIVDVREPNEYATMHIKGAILLPLGSITVSKLPALTNKKLIVHCQLGKRGEMACAKLLQSNSGLPVYNLEGGIDAWQKAGLPVEKSAASSKTSMEQQVELVAGGGVLVGLILGYIVQPGFLFLAALFALALVLKGLSIFDCYTMLLSNLPWNKK